MTDENCTTTPDGNCVSPEPCMHTPPLSAEALARLRGLAEAYRDAALAYGVGSGTTGSARAAFDSVIIALLRDPAVLLSLLSEREALAREVEALNDRYWDANAVLCRVFDDGDEALTEWLAWYKPDQWLTPDRALGAFIRTRIATHSPRTDA